MPSSALRWFALVVMSLAAGVARAQEPEPLDDEGTDLLAHRYAELRVSAYVPKVPPQVRCLRSAEEAAAFCALAWNEPKEALQIDYEHEQIVVVAWGALRWAPKVAGNNIEIQLERAVVRGDTLLATVRTVLPPGPGIDIAEDQEGRTWYPSLFFRTPKTDRVVLDLVGARRHGGAPDFRPVTEPGLEVRIGPDSCPSRERLRLQRRRLSVEQPTVELGERDDDLLLEVGWGTFGPGAYRLELVDMLLDRGTAHLTLRADNRAIISYSGPGVERPGLALSLPKVGRVLLHVERMGMPLEAGKPDFEPLTRDRLTVTVDRSRVHTGR